MKALGYLPLAIEQAGAYISDAQIRLDEYLPLYKRYHRDLLQRLPLCDICNNRQETVYTTWEVSYRTLELQDDGTARLLLLLTFLHRESAWEGLFHLAIGQTREVGSVDLPVDLLWLVDLYKNKFAFSSAIGRIMSFSLAKRGVPPPPGTIKFHPLVHSWGRDRLSSMTRKRHEIHAMVIVGRAAETLAKHPSLDEDGSLKRRLLSNADACLEIIETDADAAFYSTFISEPSGLTALYFIANLYVEFGRLHQAESILRHVQKPEDDDSQLSLRIQCQSRLADVLAELAQLEEAKRLHEDSLTRLNGLFDDIDPRVLTATNGLGNVLWNMRRIPEAMKVLESLIPQLARCTSDMTELHRAAAATLSLVYAQSGMMKEAVASQQQVIDSLSKDTSVDVLSTLEPQYKMAIVLQLNGEWSQAIAIFSDVFTTRLKLLGPDTLDTARSANSLGRISYFLGDFTRARELLDFAWKQMHKLKLGNTHQAMLRTLYNLGVLNREEGFYEEALELLEHASELQLAFGAIQRNHDYLLCQIALAELKNEYGQPEEAITILTKVLSIQKSGMQPEQPDCIRAIRVMAQSLIQVGDLTRAEEVLSETSKSLTANHPEGLLNKVVHAKLRLCQNRGDEVLEGLKDTVSRLSRVLGTEHPETILARSLLGHIMVQLGLEQEGLEIFRLSTEALTKCLGTEHPKVKRLVELQATSVASTQRPHEVKGKTKQMTIQ